MRLLAIALTGVLIVLSVVAIVGGFALLARRLLGLRFGMVRLLVAGLLAFAVAGPIARAVSGPLPATGGAVRGRGGGQGAAARDPGGGRARPHRPLTPSSLAQATPQATP